MVSRKYLCAAPHPTTWEERAKALLKSLGNDPKKREQALRQTLTLLKASRPPEKKRTGPGRKTNAEHAINFYNYALEQNESYDEGSVEKESEQEASKQSPSDRRAPVAERPAKRRRTKEESEGSDDSEDDDDSDSDERTTSSSRMSSIDTEDFLEQHNDLCEVCNIGGELLCCSTCNLVFHMECTRPMLQKIPSDNWSCSYCVASGLTGYKREAKARRRAAAACRQMDRMREEKLQQRTEAGKNDGAYKDDEAGKDVEAGKDCESAKDDDAQKMPAKPETPEATEGEAGNDAKDTKPDSEETKTKEALTETAGETAENEAAKEANVENDTEENETELEKGKPEKSNNNETESDGAKAIMSPGMLAEEENKRQIRRERRPPTIYDPQSGAASHWQSDGIIEWRYLEKVNGKSSDDEDDSDDDESSKEEEEDAAATTETKSSDGPAWCSFCKDDPAIPICCFCACRVCFGKHSGDKLLLCDSCDQEYHTFCLNPPLVSVPASKKWFCPSCKAEKAKIESSPAKRKAAKQVLVTVKRSPGRPKKNATPPPEPVRWMVRGPDGKFISKSTPKGKKAARALAKKTPSPAKSKAGGSTPRRGRPPGRKSAKKAAKTTSNSSTKRLSSTGRSSQDAARKQNPGSSPSTKFSKQGTTKAEGRQGVTAKASLSEKPAVAVVAKKDAQASVQASGNKAQTGGSEPSGNTPTADKSGNQQSGGLVSKPSSIPTQPTNPGVAHSASGADPTATQAPSPYAQAFVAAPPLQKSRSGRTVKRNSFHDEVDEGEQHLRVVKAKSYAEEMARKKAQLSMEKQKEEAAAKSSVSPPLPPTGSSLSSSAQAQPSHLGTQDVNSVAPQAAGNVAISKTESSSTTAAATVVKSTVNSGSASLPAQASTTANVGEANATEPTPVKVPRRKPGARECMQISRRFGVQPIPKKYMDTLLDYCTRGKVEHLIRMRERLDDHSRFLEAQLAGLEALVKEKGELDIAVPPEPTEGTDSTSAGAHGP